MEYDIKASVDADYAHKAEDRRSISGVAVRCGGTPLSLFSRTQKCVTLSTTKAEYAAMADWVKEALYVRRVLFFLFPCLGSPSIGVLEHTKGAVDFTENPLSRPITNTSMCPTRVGREGRLVGHALKHRRTTSAKAIGRESFEEQHDFHWGYESLQS